MRSPSTRIGRQTSLLPEQSHEHLALPAVSAWQLSVTPRAYRTVITIPKTQSQEKISLLLTVGAEVLTVPEKPYSDPDTYNRIAQRLAEGEGLVLGKPV